MIVDGVCTRFGSREGEFSSPVLRGLGVVPLLIRDPEIELGGKGGIVKANGVPPSPLSPLLLPMLSFPPPPPPLRFDVPENTFLRNGDDCAGLCDPYSERRDPELRLGDSIVVSVDVPGIVEVYPESSVKNWV